MMIRAIIYASDGTHLIDTDAKKDTTAQTVSNDLRPMRPLFRKALRKMTDEEGVSVQIPFKNEPHIIMTPESRHATIRAAYNTSH